MSFYDNSSLAFLPSSGAGKDGKAYSIKPTDGTGDFTFSRGSNLAATRVGPTGLIEKGRENVLLQSNSFSNASWALNGATLTSGQSGYDGSSDAWSLISTTANGSHRIIQTFTGVSNSIVTYSVFAKSNGYDFLRIIENASTGDFATFNLSNGSVINNTGIADTAIIESVGNGWYRCSISVDGGNVTRFDIYTMETSGATDFLGDGVSGAYIQDAQVELGLAATDYIESGATTGKAGLLEDEPRFDYSGGATCPSLLLEPSRTNLINYSEYFGSGWSFSNISPTYNHSISPEGLRNATLMSPTTSDAYLREMSNSFISGNTYVASIYLKSNSGSNFDLDFRLRESGGGQNVTETKTITTEWQRFDISLTATITGTYQFWIGGSASWSLGEDLLIWGAQVEQGSYPTSYIPNHSGGTITRSLDSCSVTGASDVIGQTEGTFVMNFNYKHNQINTPLFETSKTNSNIYALTLSDFKIRFWITLSGSNEVVISTSTIPSEGNHKLAVAYKQNDACFYLDGVLVGNDTSCSIPAVSELYLNQPNADVFEFIHFKERLSNADLATLTTI